MMTSKAPSASPACALEGLKRPAARYGFGSLSRDDDREQETGAHRPERSPGPVPGGTWRGCPRSGRLPGRARTHPAGEFWRAATRKPRAPRRERAPGPALREPWWAARRRKGLSAHPPIALRLWNRAQLASPSSMGPPPPRARSGCAGSFRRSSKQEVRVLGIEEEISARRNLQPRSNAERRRENELRQAQRLTAFREPDHGGSGPVWWPWKNANPGSSHAEGRGFRREPAARWARARSTRPPGRLRPGHSGPTAPASGYLSRGEQPDRARTQLHVVVAKEKIASGGSVGRQIAGRAVTEVAAGRGRSPTGRRSRRASSGSTPPLLTRMISSGSPSPEETERAAGRFPRAVVNENRARQPGWCSSRETLVVFLPSGGLLPPRLGSFDPSILPLKRKSAAVAARR